MGPAYSIASTMGPMVAAAGTGAPLSLVALSAIMLCIAAAFAQLSAAAPNAGSSYSWIRMAFGDVAGAYGAWLLLLSNFFATLATAVPAGIYTLDLIAPGRSQDPRLDAIVGALWVVVSAVLLYVGIRPTAVVTAIALAIEFLVLGASAIASALAPHHASAAHASVAPPVAFSLGGFVTAMTLGIWMSDGWEVSASTSEEVDGDARASGRGGIAGLVATTVVLVLAIVAYTRLAGVAGLAANQADALRYVGDLLGGGAWRAAILITVLVSTSSTLWTTILYLSRSVFAMGRDGVLPRPLGALDVRSEPLAALIAVAILLTAFELLTGFSKTAADALDVVLNISSVFLGLLFVGSAAAAVKLFRRQGWRKVGLPLAGLAGLGSLLALTVAFEEPLLRLYALGGVCIGVPFALWRGAAAKAAGQPPEGYEPTALTP